MLYNTMINQTVAFVCVLTIFNERSYSTFN